MDNSTTHAAQAFETSLQQMPEMMDKLTAAARPGAVFGEPVRQGDYTLITASEVTSAGGFGTGSAFGHEAQPSHTEGMPPEGQDAGQGQGGRAGTGGGGGGAAGAARAPARWQWSSWGRTASGCSRSSTSPSWPSSR